MTIPSERYRALVQMRGRLYAIALSTGRVSKRELRREVASLLKHYPAKYELERMAKKCPDLLKP